MSLWIDTPWISSADLDSVDGESSNVASSEGMQLDGANGICRRSLEESGREVLRSMVGFAGFLAGDALTANHLQAVFNIGVPAVQRTRVLLDNIVVDGPNSASWSELKNWVVHRALIYLYRAADNRSLNDRYKAKREIYEKRTRWSLWPQLQDLGIPVVYRNMPCPAAYMAHNPGAFNIALATGSSSFNGSQIDVAISYVDPSYPGFGPSSPNNESGLSAVTTLSPTSGQTISVDISNLLPPNGNGDPVDVARCIITPLNASQWNIYAGLHGGTLTLQNSIPIQITTKTHTITGLSTNLKVAGPGQYANAYLKTQQTLQRG